MAILEIAASVLVLVPRCRVQGAGLALGTGAIFHTAGPVGIDPYGDGGTLFKEACFTWAMAALIPPIHGADALALLRSGLRRPPADRLRPVARA